MRTANFEFNCDVYREGVYNVINLPDIFLRITIFRLIAWKRWNP